MCICDVYISTAVVYWSFREDSNLFRICYIVSFVIHVFSPVHMDIFAVYLLFDLIMFRLYSIS